MNKKVGETIGSSRETDPEDTQREALTEIDRLQAQLDALKARLFGRSPQERNWAVRPVLVRRLIENRRERERIFGADLFSDPAWDILLELFLAELRQQRVAISNVGQASGVPPTTALRWIVKLETSGLISRRPDRLDARRVFIELSPAGREAMAAYFASVRGDGAGNEVAAPDGRK